LHCSSVSFSIMSSRENHEGMPQFRNPDSTIFAWGLKAWNKLKNSAYLVFQKGGTFLKKRLGFYPHISSIRSALKKFRLRIALKQTGLLCGKLILYAHGTIFFLVLIFSILYSHLNPPVTSLMLYRILFNGVRRVEIRYTPLDQIPRKMQRMVVQIEDYKFYRHGGIDVQALINAYKLNRRLGSVRYGGSTISMQLARTLYLVPKQSYVRKYLEILIALEMDLIMKKNRILELYLNYCEWGKGVYGIGAAAELHYNREVQDLSTDQCRRLATILASPLRYSVNDFEDRKSLQRRYDFLVERFP
jgi:monofunctional biosynthetic peptidoglycan transglycosylase